MEKPNKQMVLKQSLKNLGLSATELSKLVGVSAPALNHWFSKYREVPDPVLACLRLFAKLSKEVQPEESAGAVNDQHEPSYERVCSFRLHGKGAQGRRSPSREQHDEQSSQLVIGAIQMTSAASQ